MPDSRPVFVNPLKTYLPVTAVVSILHRISGVILILLAPLLLWVLALHMGATFGFACYQAWQETFWFLFVLWGGFAALGYHVLAGLRHLLMDFGHCESLRSARASAWMLLVLFLIYAVYLGVRLC